MATQATPVQNLQRQSLGGNKSSFASLMDRFKDSIISKIPRHANAERLFNVARASVLSNGKLLECDPTGVLLGIGQIVQMGLEPNGPTGQAYLLPRWNSKARRYEAQVIISYKGFIDLALRSETCVDIEAQVVYEKDEFSFVRTSKGPQLRHVPFLDEDPGAMKLAYAVAWRERGRDQIFPHFEIIPARDIRSLKDRFMPTDRNGKPVGPWVTDEAEMWRKTAVRRLAKYLQLSPDMSYAAALDGAVVVSTGDQMDQALNGANRLVYEDEESESSEPSSAKEAAQSKTEEKSTSSAQVQPKQDAAPVASKPAPATPKAQEKPAQEASPAPAPAQEKSNVTPIQKESVQPATQNVPDPFDELDMFLGE